ncbi:hypothetical protein Trydic_g7011 [Trypoxylus dichotomus]
MAQENKCIVLIVKKRRWFGDGLEVFREYFCWELLVLSGLQFVGEKFTFQLDSEPKHIAKIYRDYLQEKQEESSFRVMVWPPQSSDLNAIECL